MKEKPASDYPFYDIPGPIVIAHRGGDAAGAEKENSLAAFDSASQAGFIYGETDIVATRDGIALTLHGAKDAKQSAEFNLPIISVIEDMDYADVKRHVRVGGEIIPTLEEVLTTFPNMRFFIDPKADQSVLPLGNLIKKLRIQDRVSIGAFDYNRTKAVAEMVGGQRDVCTALAFGGNLAMLSLNVLPASARTYLKRTQATSLQTPHWAVNSHVIKRAHDLGIHVIVWPYKKSSDNRAYMEKALDQGVHGLMSDHTLEMKDAVLSRNPDNPSIRS